MIFNLPQKATQFLTLQLSTQIKQINTQMIKTKEDTGEQCRVEMVINKERGGG